MDRWTIFHLFKYDIVHLSIVHDPAPPPSPPHAGIFGKFMLYSGRGEGLCWYPVYHKYFAPTELFIAA